MKLLDWNICIKLDNNDGVLEFIDNLDVDVCALQEVMNGIDDSCFEMYRSRNRIVSLENYHFSDFAPLFEAEGVTKNGEMARDFGGKAQQGSLIISKYGIKKSYNQFYYNEYRYSYDATEFREKDWCRSIQNVILDVNGKSLQVINVHGIWNKDKLGDERTILQSEFILNKLRTDIPAIVVGDFNLLPESESIGILNMKLRNLVNEYGYESTRSASTESLVCDYVFVNDKVKVNDFRIVETEISDHLPLVLDFDI